VRRRRKGRDWLGSKRPYEMWDARRAKEKEEEEKKKKKKKSCTVIISSFAYIQDTYSHFSNSQGESPQ